jgi:hypothetical protein
MTDLSADALGKELAEALDEIDALRGNQTYLAKQCETLKARLDIEMDDVFRFDWVLPILCAQGGTGDMRAMALALQLTKGLDGREAIDAARAELERTGS